MARVVASHAWELATFLKADDPNTLFANYRDKNVSNTQFTNDINPHLETSRTAAYFTHAVYRIDALFRYREIEGRVNQLANLVIGRPATVRIVTDSTKPTTRTDVEIRPLDERELLLAQSATDRSGSNFAVYTVRARDGSPVAILNHADSVTVRNAASTRRNTAITRRNAINARLATDYKNLTNRDNLLGSSSWLGHLKTFHSEMNKEELAYRRTLDP